MNKIISIFAILLFSTGAYAKGCDNGSLKGKYGYEVSGVNLVPVNGIPTPLSTHVVGQALFNPGNGTVDIFGKGATAGHLEERTGHGDYDVDSTTCVASGTITWVLPADAQPGTSEEISHFYIVLDHTDNSDSHSANKAYHANVVVSSNAPYSSSASGTLTKFVGKFH